MSREVMQQALDVLYGLEQEFRKVFPIYYYAEPWAHDRNEALKTAQATLQTLKAELAKPAEQGAELVLPKPDCPNIWGGCYSEKQVREIIAEDRATQGAELSDEQIDDLWREIHKTESSWVDFPHRRLAREVIAADRKARGGAA